MNTPYSDYLILGGGVAGCSAAQTIRCCQPEASIQILSREEPCLRPLLTKASFQGIGGSALDMGGTDWFRSLSIDLVSCNVTALDPQNHSVQTDRGTFFYGKCIYALGSEAILPPFPGCSLPGVFTVRHPRDMAAIKQRLLRVRNAVVIGGGVIGIEAGEMLASYGIAVTILEGLPYLMPRILDPETAEEYRSRLSPVRVETGIAVDRLLGETAVTGVSLKGGRMFPCELVIVSCGVQANIAIAAAAGLELQRGIPVNGRMETGLPDVYACGDCAQYEGQCPSLWQVARDQGYAAAMNACGRDVVYNNVPSPVLFHSSKASLFALGLLQPPESSEYRVETNRYTVAQPELINPRSCEAYRRLVFRGNRLVGAALIGDLSQMSQLQQQIIR